MSVDQDTCNCGTEMVEEAKPVKGGCTCGCCGPAPEGERAKSGAGVREGD